MFRQCKELRRVLASNPCCFKHRQFVALSHTMNRFALLFAGLVCASSAISQSAEIKFKVVPDFFEKTPGGEALGACHGAALVDKAGNFYITTDTTVSYTHL